ncbi:hypothetical protein [Aliikangiella sp. G2MR2-5]|uniref:hypothetical protein n=1 Tax=Aliikangiella sp. G2MR2-5 TaxID=2788943 RepID=UPI0018AC37A3|nr:hypothetical protein [Aliikangiella sp. G2MR2-5]
MRYITLLIVLFSFYAIAEEECVFDEKSQEEFIGQYLNTSSNAEKIKGEKGVRILRGAETIEFHRGGCVHFGISIKSKIPRRYNEEEFFGKVITLVTEFGTELVNIQELKAALASRKWEKYEDMYFVQVESVSSFEMSKDSKGEANVNFYNN